MGSAENQDTLSNQEISRYSRQLIIPKFGIESNDTILMIPF